MRSSGSESIKRRPLSQSTSIRRSCAAARAACALPVLRRASDFASRVMSKCEFPRGFVGCSVPVLSVSFLKPVLQNPGFLGFFAFLGNCFGVLYRPCNSVHGGMRRCISRRAPKIESFFESRDSSKHWGFECFGSGPIHTLGGGRNRTICVMF
jgi:hypothetical protein